MRSAHDVAADSVAFNVQPRATGQILVGSSRQLAGGDRSVNGDILRRMLARAAAFLPRLPALSAIRAWTGLRPATPDGLPLVRRWDAVPGTWIAAGHEGLGITTALATAEILADLLLGRPTAIDAAPLAPSADRLRAAPPPRPASPREPPRVPPGPPRRGDPRRRRDPRRRPHARRARRRTLAAALLGAGVLRFRSSVDGAPRAPLCGMGTCFECRVTVDGEPHRRACLVEVAAGMRVECG